jgi:rubrerythrin
MSSQATLGELFDLALAAEETAEALYRRLAAMFAQQEQVAAFWRSFAAAEAGHAAWLRRLRERTEPQRLDTPADPLALEQARQASRLSVGQLLADVRTLEDAFDLANELEHSEINVVFEFLITNFAADQKTQDFLRRQLRDHVAKLTHGFPEAFSSPSQRKWLKALD